MADGKRVKNQKGPGGTKEEKSAGVSSVRLHAHFHCWTKQSRCALAHLMLHVLF